MKFESRESIQRAIGLIEGISYVVGSRAQDALTTAIEIIDAVLAEENKLQEQKEG